MKATSILCLLFFTLSTQAETGCTYTRNLYVEVEGEEVPKELKNKILNEYNPDEVFLIKKNEEMALKICGTARALKNVKDVPVNVAGAKEEHSLIKVKIRSEKNFWLVKMEGYIRNAKGELVLQFTEQEEKTSKPAAEMKYADMAAWVGQKVKFHK